jgi:hypothetical protein
MRSVNGEDCTLEGSIAIPTVRSDLEYIKAGRAPAGLTLKEHIGILKFAIKVQVFPLTHRANKTHIRTKGHKVSRLPMSVVRMKINSIPESCLALRRAHVTCTLLFATRTQSIANNDKLWTLEVLCLVKNRTRQCPGIFCGYGTWRCVSLKCKFSITQADLQTGIGIAPAANTFIRPYETPAKVWSKFGHRASAGHGCDRK